MYISEYTHRKVQESTAVTTGRKVAIILFLCAFLFPAVSALNMFYYGQV